MFERKPEVREVKQNSLVSWKLSLLQTHQHVTRCVKGEAYQLHSELLSTRCDRCTRLAGYSNHPLRLQQNTGKMLTHANMYVRVWWWMKEC